jgi:hypothetical protein
MNLVNINYDSIPLQESFRSRQNLAQQTFFTSTSFHESSLQESHYLGGRKIDEKEKGASESLPLKGWSVRENVTELNVFNLNVWRCEVVPLSERRSFEAKTTENFYDKLCHSSSRSLYKQSEQNKLKLREHFLCFSLTEAALCISIPGWGRTIRLMSFFIRLFFWRGDFNRKSFQLNRTIKSCSGRPKVHVTRGHLLTQKSSNLPPSHVTKHPFSPFSLMRKFSGLIISEITKCVRAP